MNNRLANSGNNGHQIRMVGKLEPPTKLDAERAVLGSMMLLNATIPGVLDIIDADSFHAPAHRAVFNAVVELHTAGRPVDATTVIGKLNQQDAPNGDWFPFLANILAATGNATFAESYAEDVREASLKRKFIEPLDKLAGLLYDPSSSIDSIITMAGEFSETASRTITVDDDSLRTITSAELASTTFSLRYIVDHFLVEGQPCVLAGPKKVLKTTLAIQLLLQLSAGRMFLGKFPTTATKCGFFSAESGPHTIQETFKRLAKAEGLPPQNFPIHWSFDVPKIDDPAEMRRFEKIIVDEELKVVAIDPAYLALGNLGDSAGNLFSVGEKLMELTRLGQRTGATIILLHHTKKGVANPNEPPELEDIAWSGFQEWARQWILVGRRERYDPENSGHHKLWLSFGGSAGHGGALALDIDEGSPKDPGGRRWEYEVFNASQARAEAAQQAEEVKQSQREQQSQIQTDADRSKIIEVLEKFRSGETKSIIRDTAGINPKRFNRVMAEMIADDTVKACTITKGNGREYDGYQLPEFAQSDTRTHSDTKPSD